MERLYTALLPRCFGCDRAELRSSSAIAAATAASSGGGDSGGDDAEEGGGSVRREAEKGSKVGSSNDGPDDLLRVVSSSNYSYDEAEALTEEIEKESQIIEEVLRIEEILINTQDQTTGCEPFNSTFKSKSKSRRPVILLLDRGATRTMNRCGLHQSCAKRLHACTNSAWCGFLARRLQATILLPCGFQQQGDTVFCFLRSCIGDIFYIHTFLRFFLF